MRGKDLLECMEYIDDALIQEALEPDAFPHRNNITAKWCMAAACVVVMGISATALWSHQNIRDEGPWNAGQEMAVPMAMDTAAENNGSTESTLENSLTVGAVAEDAQADVMTEARQDTNKDLASGMDNPVSQDTMADATSGWENAAVQKLENEIKEMVEEEHAKLKYTIISDYYGEKEDAVYDYPVPEKGKFFCYNDLQETMDHYAAMENAAETEEGPVYAYEVVVDIFGDIEIEGCRGIYYEQLNMLDNSEAGNEMIEREYRRLTGLGYSVRLSEDFQLTGIFTKAELDTFQTSPEYGYTFRFANANQ